MAGEPLHFVAAATGAVEALGAIPLDVSDSVVASCTSGANRAPSTRCASILKYAHNPTPTVSHAPSHSRPRGASRLRVDKRFTQRMDSATEARIEDENELARDVGRTRRTRRSCGPFPFCGPRQSRVTSRFGSGRVFNGRVSSSHLGVDYRGALGEPIYAANRGVVALVASFFLAGNVVYIDHGDGLVTGYFHMSQPEVAVGDTVERGQEIGLVGATGRVTGPHLHWSARFGALTIDPADLLSLGAPFVAGHPKKSLRPARQASRSRKSPGSPRRAHSRWTKVRKIAARSSRDDFMRRLLLIAILDTESRAPRFPSTIGPPPRPATLSPSIAARGPRSALLNKRHHAVKCPRRT